MNTLTTDASGPGDIFFTDETWLLEGFNDIQAWVEAGQLFDRYFGLQYMWAQMWIPPSRDLDEIVFQLHRLGPVTAKDATAGTVVTIRRTQPDTFRINVLASESSYEAETENHMWTRAMDWGLIDIGLELAGTSGAFAQPVTMQPLWYDDQKPAVLQKWGPRPLSTSSSTTSGPPTTSDADSPIYASWLQEPSPIGAIWLTSCCTQPTSALGPPSNLSQSAGMAAIARPLAQPAPTTPAEAKTPIDHPPIVPIGVAPANIDLVAQPDLLPKAVADGLLGKIGASPDVAITGSDCDSASVVEQALPGPATAGLDDTRGLCWFTLSGDFGVQAPPTPAHAATTFRFNSAYAVFDAQSHSLISAGAFHPVP